VAYKLAFKNSAWAEWQALDGAVRAQFKKVLLRRLEEPHVLSAKLRDLPNCYKIKLRALGYRLVYQVSDTEVTVTVITVGKRERNKVYTTAKPRL
jgi:mRNA interferase RelE/StbE